MNLDPQPGLTLAEANAQAKLSALDGETFKQVYREGQFWIAVYATGPRIPVPNPEPGGNEYVQPIRRETVGPALIS